MEMKKIMTWTLTWLNMSAAALNAYASASSNI